ncbi:MAG: hypothetical protein IPK26_30800 [Planctomycetes bacterium]|nr:hypothetical protein [Planctomycetota bacterium]
MSAVRSPALVVVSFWDGRPRQELDALLHDLATIPAGWPFAVLVVVNQERAEPTAITASLPGLRVLHRPNTGYNIGAWDHGYRSAPDHDVYLFLQQECRVRRPDWLLPFVQRLQLGEVGLVGERANPAWDRPWDEIERRFAGHELHDHFIEGRPAPRLATYRHFFAQHGIEPGLRGDHLQTLVLAATGATLRRIGGFPVGRDYGESIAAEISVSKRVQALGLTAEQLGPRPFTCFSHPQWQDKADRQPLPAPRLSLGTFLHGRASKPLFDARPWLVLGKGPTFAQFSAAHRQQHNLFALNHVVRETAVDLAHAIDIDVVKTCAAHLDAHARFLLMPRVPHVDSRPGERLLEEWLAEIPELYELERRGRLVWYNCSTARPHPGSPVIEVQCFSSEAAFGILAAMGVRTIRSLGIDGGRQYSGTFADLAGTTRLQNGQPLFDQQFVHLDRLVRRHRLEWRPLATPQRIWIRRGNEPELAARVLEHSIKKHATMPVAIEHERPGVVAPGDALVVDAAALATADLPADAARLRAGGWLQPLPARRPWLAPDEAAAGPWLDAFAEAVNAGAVTRRQVQHAVSASAADARLLSPLTLASGAAAGGEAGRLRRELAQMRLSRTWQVGCLLVRPALLAQRLLWRRVR